jgi:hypothetical protein
MGRLPKFLKGSALLVCTAIAASAALQLPAGTELEIRLKTKISTQTAKVKDPVETVVIAPVLAGEQVAIPAGALVRGVVEKVTASTKPNERASILVSFNEIEIDGKKLKLAAQVSAVDNAREKVDDKGLINGIVASETITGRLDTGINRVTERYSGFGGFLGSLKGVVLKPAEGDIVYEPGVDLTLKLTAPLEMSGPSSSGPTAKLEHIPDQDSLPDFIAGEPFQTVAQSPPKPSDITNLMLLGTEDQVRKTFADAGWTTAAGLNAVAKFETFRALAENRGYSEAPVSILLLDGRPPDIVFQKLNNTFERRHHLRVWRRPTEFGGKTVWMIAATHDTGISFSEANRTFIHLIDGQIDRERAKVVNDLVFTGRVSGIALVERENVPKSGQNATGDNIETDARLAVLLLN